MGEVIDFMVARQKRRKPIYNFKVNTKEDHEFLLANLDRIMIELPIEDTHHEEKS